MTKRQERLMWALQNLEDMIGNGRNLIVTIEGGADEDVWVDVKVEEILFNHEHVELFSYIAAESVEEALTLAGEGVKESQQV